MNKKNSIQPPLVSVVIPVYNTAKYLKRCLDSVIEQTYPALEIILVDDGSIDGSAKICDDFTKQDNRVHVIHQKNQGVALARINGTTAAHGTYVTFVDSDDYISSDMIRTMVNIMLTEKTDLVVCQLNKVEDEHIYSFPERPDPGVYDRKRIKLLLQERCMYDSATCLAGISWEIWGKLYSKSKILPYLKNGLGLWYEEDMVVLFSYLCHVEKMVVLSEHFYQYVTREGQATQNYRPDMVNNFKRTIEKLAKLDTDGYLKNQLPIRVFIEVRRILSICTQHTKGRMFFQQVFEEITNNQLIMEYLLKVERMQSLTDTIKHHLLIHKYGRLYYIMIRIKHKLEGKNKL